MAGTGARANMMSGLWKPCRVIGSTIVPLLKRNVPYYWHSIELSNPIVPVVGVSWYEAEAYCNWLSKKIVAVPEGYTVRLPRDNEWERASRGTMGRNIHGARASIKPPPIHGIASRQAQAWVVRLRFATYPARRKP